MLEPDAVESQTFPRAFRGYRRAEVEAFLLAVAEELRRLGAELEAARRGPDATEVVQALNEARRAADRLTAEARQQAEALLEDARRQAGALREAAAREAEAARAEADTRLAATRRSVQELEDRATALRAEITRLETARSAALRDLASLGPVLDALHGLDLGAEQLRQAARQAEARLQAAPDAVPAPNLTVVRN
ncbi:protein of unknown function [Candidatus Hydrogenisulfobacillus filiaventi]|uniref:Cell division initiation protein DivIVA n=1 Tax=Candidatus Hydrogenisulfobacillus filiaventi TaxID=2707344 RepID=A0A6F8ZDD7_9FIRM|nr:DivIVA domain-containing protein [Bacillota bacterium]CAB1127765.1 protein of unknown function [Candidatus Hydrogenisulfobacillus filiaventi]